MAALVAAIHAGETGARSGKVAAAGAAWVPGTSPGMTEINYTCIAEGAPPRANWRVRGGWVYIVTNRPNGTLYLGVTSDLARRVWQHRTGELPGFTKRYGLGRLVWYEAHDDIRIAIQRERTMKHWSRAWKVRVILDLNPDWSDLYDRLNA